MTLVYANTLFSLNLFTLVVFPITLHGGLPSYLGRSRGDTVTVPLNPSTICTMNIK